MSEQTGAPGPDDGTVEPATDPDEPRQGRPGAADPVVGDESDPYELRSVPTQADPTDDDPASYLGR